MRNGGDPRHALELVLLEGVLVAAISAVQRGIQLCQSLLRAQLGQRVNVMILEKALTLELQHFEDSEFYDKLTRARREASTRPLSLVMRTFFLVQNGISLIELRRAARAFLALGGRGAAGGGAAGLRRRGEVLRGCLSAVPLALARDAHADLPRDRARARRPRQGSQALRSGRAAARALPRHLPSVCTRRTARSPSGATCGASRSASSAPSRSTVPTPGSR